jgi:putative glycosyltransferase (TIGR04348 family)
VPRLRAHPLRILVVTPAPPRARSGNRVTALRWARRLRELGHRVAVDQEYRGGRPDVLVALHARRSHPSIARFARERPGRPLIVALTGTDLYRDIGRSQRARQSLELAWRLVLLQPLGIDAVPERHREKARVIRQSATAPAGPVSPRRERFDACVLAHLRAVKDPLLAARAARLLPSSSRVRVLHLGAALEEGTAARARAEERRDARYRWLGERPHGAALRVLRRCRLLLVTSRLEGGANVVSEALACGVPILSTRIPGSVGILGADYAGYFPVGDARALANLLRRAESDTRFYRALKRRCGRLRGLVAPSRERACWSRLLAEIRPPKRARRDAGGAMLRP